MDLARQIEPIVGANNVSNKPWIAWAYSKDASVVEGAVPSVVVMPKTTEEVQAIMKLANDTKTPVFPRGSGTALWGAVPVKGAIVIDTARLNHVKEIDDETLVCVTEPGITFGELDAILHKRGYRFLVAPENAQSGTIGGHFASHGTGTGSATYGYQGDCVLGLKVVLPNGELLATGSGLHPHKPRHFCRYAYANDLTGLFCGSEGTLGTIVEVALKIERLPEAMDWATFRFDDWESACEAGMMVRRARIPCLHLFMGNFAPLDILDPKGAPHDPIRTNFTIEGDRDCIGIHKKRLIDICQEYGEYLGEGPARNSWMERWRTMGVMFTLGVRAMIPYLVPFGKGAAVFCKDIDKASYELTEKYKEYKLNVFFVAGFGVDRGWLFANNVIYDESDPIQHQKAREALREIQDRAYELGAVPYRVGTYWAKDMQELGLYYDVLKKVKDVLDPNHIMSPGVLGL